MTCHTCRCPGKFFAEAEVALIALLLLSEYNAELSSTDIMHDTNQQAKNRGTTLDSLEMQRSGNNQADCNGQAVSKSSSCRSAVNTPGEHASGHKHINKDRTDQESSCSHDKTLACACRASTDTQVSREEQSRHCTGTDALPLPELRRQVGVRWPQSDLFIYFC